MGGRLHEPATRLDRLGRAAHHADQGRPLRGDQKVPAREAAPEEGPGAPRRRAGGAAVQDVGHPAPLRLLRARGLPAAGRPDPPVQAGHHGPRRHKGRRGAARGAARRAAQAGAPQGVARDGRALRRPRLCRRQDVAREAVARRVCKAVRAAPGRLRGARRPHLRGPQGDGPQRGRAAPPHPPPDRAVARRPRGQEGGRDPVADAGAREQGLPREPAAERRRPAAAPQGVARRVGVRHRVAPVKRLRSAGEGAAQRRAVRAKHSGGQPWGGGATAEEERGSPCRLRAGGRWVITCRLSCVFVSLFGVCVCVSACLRPAVCE
mmetsp:Transcript_22441/g.74418  ORF Transcript_22441/g.74418 Transcript_22441/m.74418 type:complete len:321 (+) Transcript_22441:660-1622(+)